MHELGNSLLRYRFAEKWTGFGTMISKSGLLVAMVCTYLAPLTRASAPVSGEPLCLYMSLQQETHKVIKAVQCNLHVHCNSSLK